MNCAHKGTPLLLLALLLTACRDNEITFESAESIERCEKQSGPRIQVREGIAETLLLNYRTYGIDKITSVQASGSLGVVELSTNSALLWSSVIVYGKTKGEGKLVVTAVDDDGNRMTVNIDVDVVGQEAVLPRSDSESCNPDAGTTDSDAGDNAPDATRPLGDAGTD